MTKTFTTQLLHKRVSIRRSGKVVRGVLTQSLVSEIRDGRLKKDDEISADEKCWIRLDRAHQLSKYFSSVSSLASEKIPSDMDKRLAELSEMLKDLNQ